MQFGGAAGESFKGSGGGEYFSDASPRGGGAQSGAHEATGHSRVRTGQDYRAWRKGMAQRACEFVKQYEYFVQSQEECCDGSREGLGG